MNETLQPYQDAEERYQLALDEEQSEVMLDPEELTDLYRDVFCLDFDPESGGRLLAEMMRELREFRRIIEVCLPKQQHLARVTNVEVALNEMLLARARDRAEVRLSKIRREA